MLAARLGPLGHGSGFGGFLYPGKPVWLPLNKKTVGPFPPPVEFFLFKKNRKKIEAVASSKNMKCDFFSVLQVVTTLKIRLQGLMILLL